MTRAGFADSPGHPGGPHPDGHPGSHGQHLMDGPPAAGPVCGWCGAPNQPERHFCGRCATALHAAAPAPFRLPWWRRLLVRRAEVLTAGQRPRPRGELWRGGRWFAGAAALALLVSATTLVRPTASAVTDRFAARVPVEPVAVAASHSYPGHGPQFLFDKVSNTWWGSGYGGEPVNTWVEASFAQPEHLLNLVITPGVSADPGQEVTGARPRDIDLVATNAEGTTTTVRLELASVGVQNVALHLPGTVKVRLVTRTAYGAAPTKQVAVAEVEFFGTTSPGY
ncbi:NADase-type glycan-binding domain-containing protein [Kitasatospora sp. NPDC088346]|uniref:NADase-type glycan-binding domain-containing protein n=1 Tax=Kitasatospora sp. NPDC088346 TaxID=3364073 RepID=UPI003828524B